MLSDYCKDRNNNLNIIRFLSAIFVLYYHSFPLTNSGVDHLDQLTNGQIDFGGLTVSIFFFYGGFLICKSIIRINDGKQFFKNRLCRIMPGLALVVFVSVFVIGPVFTHNSIIEYFYDYRTYKYLLNSVFVLVHQLPGVFEDNVYNDTVNGSLWTLPVEVLCYILCYLLWKLKFLEKKKFPFVIIAAVLFYVVMNSLLAPYTLIRSALRPALLFFCGICAYVFKDIIPVNRIIAGFMFLLCIISIVMNVFNVFMFISLTYCLLFLGYGTTYKASSFGNRYEISYDNVQ